jgi:hypothetical protein
MQIIFNFRIRNEQRPNGPKQKGAESIVSLKHIAHLVFAVTSSRLSDDSRALVA